MKYTKELLIRAIKTVDKRIEKAIYAGVKFSLPELINTACVTVFLEGDNVDNMTSGNYVYSGYILKQAAEELRETGMLTFGVVNDFWC